MALGGFAVVLDFSLFPEKEFKETWVVRPNDLKVLGGGGEIYQNIFIFKNSFKYQNLVKTDKYIKEKNTKQSKTK